MKKIANDPYRNWQRLLLKHKPVLRKLEEIIQLDGGLYRETEKFKVKILNHEG